MHCRIADRVIAICSNNAIHRARQHADTSLYVSQPCPPRARGPFPASKPFGRKHNGSPRNPRQPLRPPHLRPPRRPHSCPPNLNTLLHPRPSQGRILAAYRLRICRLRCSSSARTGDETAKLRERSFKNIDPFSGASPSRHIFFGIITTFRNEYATIVLMLLIYIASPCSFAAPIGINRVLAYVVSLYYLLFKPPFLANLMIQPGECA
ncbi:hypothetical protein K438DRAFT_1976258 [Mycena galopus ATCC 62051]|nr:hypothetical protein K438DRAFT_1976258 [Mycena galopus ATCC 62051]